MYSHLQQHRLFKTCFEIEDEQLQSLAKSLTLTDNTIQKIVHHWWQTVGYSALQSQMNRLRRYHGTILRCDHTYKCVSTLGVTRDKKWVTVQSVSLTVTVTIESLTVRYYG